MLTNCSYTVTWDDNILTSGNGYMADGYEDGGWDQNRGYARGRGRGRGRGFRGRGRGGYNYNGPIQNAGPYSGGYEREPPVQNEGGYERDPSVQNRGIAYIKP